MRVLSGHPTAAPPSPLAALPPSPPSPPSPLRHRRLRHLSFFFFVAVIALLTIDILHPYLLCFVFKNVIKIAFHSHKNRLPSPQKLFSC